MAIKTSVSEEIGNAFVLIFLNREQEEEVQEYVNSQLYLVINIGKTILGETRTNIKFWPRHRVLSDMFLDNVAFVIKKSILLSLLNYK